MISVSTGEDWIKIPLVNPTFWLNHIFFTTPYHWKNNTVCPSPSPISLLTLALSCRFVHSCSTAGGVWATTAIRLASLEMSTQ